MGSQEVRMARNQEKLEGELIGSMDHEYAAAQVMSIEVLATQLLRAREELGKKLETEEVAATLRQLLKETETRDIGQVRAVAELIFMAVRYYHTSCSLIDKQYADRGGKMIDAMLEAMNAEVRKMADEMNKKKKDEEKDETSC